MMIQLEFQVKMIMIMIMTSNKADQIVSSVTPNSKPASSSRLELISSTLGIGQIILR